MNKDIIITGSKINSQKKFNFSTFSQSIMKSKAHYLLAPILLGLVTTSCDKKDLDEVTPSSSSNFETSASSNATATGILLEELFEGSDPLNQSLIMDRAQGTSYARTYSTEHALSGSKSARFELRDTDAEFGGGTRTDFAMKPATGKDRWYSFAA
ncbi:hypothetical protein D1627_18240, partial [Pontibacter oryzae]